MPSGLLNKYSVGIGIIIAILWMSSLNMVASEREVLGFVLFLIGVLMLRWGLKTLKASPLEVGIIKVFDNKTTTVVKGLTLVMPPVIDIIPIPARQKDHEFPIKPVTCGDGGVVSGKLSVSIVPRISDGVAMGEFDDAGQMEGVIELMNDLLQVGVQEEAQYSPTDFMVKQSKKVGLKILKKITGKDRGDRNSTDDARHLGCNFPKFALELYKEDKVRATEQEALMAKAIEAMIVNRLKFYQEQEELNNERRRTNRRLPRYIVPSLDEIRKQVLEEKRIREGKVEEVRGNANVRNFRQVGGN